MVTLGSHWIQEPMRRLLNSPKDLSSSHGASSLDYKSADVEQEKILTQNA